MVKNIALFGRRNVGKSSFINSFAGQEVSIVSPVAGTTTDPVKKRIELFGIGVCNIIDTAGADDSGQVGQLRVQKSEQVIDQADIAILLFAENIFAKEEMSLLAKLRQRDVPTLVVHNKSDLQPLDYSLAQELNGRYGVDVVEYSCLAEGAELEQERQLVVSMLLKLGSLLKKYEKRPILSGFVKRDDTIVLVCPIDASAPTKRIILPQVMAIRDVLDNRGNAVVLQPEELPQFLKGPINERIKLVVTDSQAFSYVNSVLPPHIPLTSFSILMARAKGPFESYLQGLKSIDNLKPGDRVLILESCTHHTTCEDIGRVKIPKKLCEYLAKKSSMADFTLQFSFVAGLDNIDLEQDYKLAIQCGGCMVTKRELVNRIERLLERNIPVTNYGMTLAFLSGIMERICYEPPMQ